MPTKSPAPDQSPPIPPSVLDLIARFALHRDDYLAGKYNETQVRREYIDPLFKALGWDIDNAQGFAEAYKDVIHEDALKIEGATKAPDYCFRVGGTRKFFLEAKKPATDIKNSPGPAFQLRRYAWSGKLPLSILTNFEEIAVYDCRVRPEKSDKASTARILTFTIDKLPEHWAEFAAIFSKDAVLKGSFDKYAESTTKKRGTAEVDDSFLQSIEDWREILAKNIALRNASLTQRELNFAVQCTLDRIVFLRICEDRGIEPYASLRAAADKSGVYAALFERFQQADDRYNSGLFHFRKGDGDESTLDELTPRLAIDDKPLASIIAQLYYPDSPYEFSVLPADILGQVYEQFLGKVIRLTAGHRAVIEEKPEVKKAGGVFYTPTYIVDHITEEALGPLLRERTVRSFKTRLPKLERPLRVLDPACGSGSFLIGAFQYLLDWYLDWYLNNGPEEIAKGAHPPIYQTGPGQYRLTIPERKRILVEHVFGVDIDVQAVEVTKVSLLLKCLEGESKQTVQKLMFTQERALPDLASNIKCGNSLVGTDVFEGAQGLLFDEEESLVINAFDWGEEFGEAGFDAIVGNPPYVYRKVGTDELKSYYRRHYQSAEGNYELYKFFLEKCSDLLAPGGRLAMIVSATCLVQGSFAKLRAFLLDRLRLDQVAPLGPGAFKKATVDTVIIVGERSVVAPDHTVTVIAPTEPRALPSTIGYPRLQAGFRANPECVIDYRLAEEGVALVRRLFADFPPFESLFEIGVGINTGYIRAELTSDSRIDDRYHPMLPGSGISRYGLIETDGWIMYDADFVREQGEKGRTLPPERLLSRPKILVVRTRNLSLKRRIIATFDDTGAYNLNRLTNIIARGKQDLHGLLAILNSRLMDWLFSTRFYDYEIKPVYLKQCPLAACEGTELIENGRALDEATKRLGSIGTPEERKQLQRRIDAIERATDRLVYKLYGLTADEVKLIESHMERAP